ncbi:Protein lin-52 like protein [Cyphomyrmex costatus]|uniref:Protein lin-52 like protein n=1 Tax=Cyphomyrmex costatus TaxID=456900 RepID=A0A151IIN7_9HYME|nr:Protein lin-52 like protein [Cyphomyrmex costatus]
MFCNKSSNAKKIKTVDSCFIDLSCIEESLMSLEKLDRASPDLWPEQTSNEVPGVHEFVAQNSPQTEPCFWAAMSQDDISHVHQLGNLSMTGLISEVKRLHDIAYQLGLEEAKEMTRGKYLNIFKHK